MRAVLVTQPGGPEVLTVEQVEQPAPASDQVLVRVAAAGVNFIDVYFRTGAYPMPLPYVAGVEGVGVIESLGEAVRGLDVGQRIGWTTGSQGSFADMTVVTADKAVPIPDDVDDATAVALLLQGMTAQYLCTSTFPVAAGDTALVHAAAGGVGQLLTQMVKNAGGTVIATVSSPEKAELVRSLGADHVIGYKGFAEAARELTGGAGVSVAYDGIGAATFDGSIASVRRRGTVALYGGASGKVPPFDPMRLSAAGSIYLTRPNLADYTATAEELRSRAADVFAMHAAGRLAVARPTQYAMADVQDAYVALESRASTGKLVLVN